MTMFAWAARPRASRSISMNATSYPDIDAGEVVVEFDGVEQRWLVVEQHDVPQVQIAMALPHGSARASPIQHGSPGIDGAFAHRGHGSRRSQVDQRSRGFERPGIVVHDRAHGVGTAALWRGCRLCVECRDAIRELQGQAAGNAASHGEAVEQPILRKALHHHHPLDGGALTAERQPAVGAASHRHDVHVQPRRRAPVEPKLDFTGATPQFQRRVIEERVTDRSLHLVCARAGEEHAGAVRVNALDRRPAWIAGRIGEPPEDRGLLVADGHCHVMTPAASPSART